MIIYNFNKKLYHNFSFHNMSYGVHSRSSHLLGVPMNVIYAAVILSLFLSFFILTIPTYIVLFFIFIFFTGRKRNKNDILKNNLILSEYLKNLDSKMAINEKRIRRIERYVTSNMFDLNNRFRSLKS